jgi:hypothetical protein
MSRLCGATNRTLAAKAPRTPRNFQISRKDAKAQRIQIKYQKNTGEKTEKIGPGSHFGDPIFKFETLCVFAANLNYESA